MKTRLGLVFALPLLLALGCAKDDGMQDGSMTVRMTDAPGLYEQVNVEIEAIHVHYSDSTDSTSGWEELQVHAGVYNLLELQNGVDTVLADSSGLPVGKVTQMRIILGDSNTVMLMDSTIVPLELSSQGRTGLKLNLNASIEPGSNVDVLFDFDAEKSIVVSGNGTLRLKPVIKLVSVE